MKKIGLMVALSLLALPLVAQNDVEEAGVTTGPNPPVLAGPTWDGPNLAAVLVDNGPLVNSPGTGVGGVDESVLQSVSLGMNILGYGHQQSTGTNRIADDFTVTGGGWIIDTCTFFAYQTGAPVNVSPITGLTLRVWDGVPGDPGSTVIFGDDTTNILQSSSFAPIYRVTEATTGTANNRGIFANVGSLGGLNLGPGTYWLDWATDGSTAFSGPWAPPITINGQDTTGNSVRTTDGGATWPPTLDDAGTDTPQGLPFICEGTQVVIGGGGAFDPNVPTLNPAGLAILFLVLAGAAVFLMRRRRA